MRKPRVKVDVALLVALLLMTGVLFSLGFLYRGYTPFIDNIFDCLGFVLILKGVIIRMIARAHKKANTNGGHQLVTTGIYQIVRNPMYLGTYYIGSGFVLILLPWWMLIVFTMIFYARFNKQIVSEESVLTKMFGKQYEEYCRQVPRILPNVSLAMKMPIDNWLKPDEMFTTKEKRGLWSWPLLAFACDTTKEYFVYNDPHLMSNSILYVSMYIVFMVIFLGVISIKKFAEKL